MKQQGVTHMEAVLIAVAVFAAGVVLINRVMPEPKKNVTQDSFKTKIEQLESKLKAYESIEQRFQDLEADKQKVWDTLDHVQNLTENGDNFMKANEQEIKNLKKLNETIQNGYTKMAQRLDHAEANLKKTPEIVKLQLEEIKKPLAVALEQSRAQRPVTVNWKRGPKGWYMDEKSVEYSRSEYLKKLKKQEKPK